MMQWILINIGVSPKAIVIAIVGYLVVFASLVLLFWLFNMLPKVIYAKNWSKMKRKGKDLPNREEVGISGETTAAISMALHLYFSELHDEESGILTIKRVSKSYSPWSSKIYAVRNQFNRR